LTSEYIELEVFEHLQKKPLLTNQNFQLFTVKSIQNTLQLNIIARKYVIPINITAKKYVVSDEARDYIRNWNKFCKPQLSDKILCPKYSDFSKLDYEV